MHSTLPFPPLTLGGLSPELTALVLAVIVGFIQLSAAAIAVTVERGSKWNMGPRDETMPPPGALAGRLDRAYRNFMETFPFFAAVILAAVASNRLSTATTLGSELYLIARILYIPAYAFGISGMRSAIWMTGSGGLILALLGLLNPALL